MFYFCSMGPSVKKIIINKRGRKKEREEEGREEGKNKDNLGDTNKLFNTSWNSIFSENCQIGQKAGSFIGLKIKDEKKKTGKYLIGLGHLIWGEKEQGGSIKASWLGIWGLANWIDWFWSSRTLQGHENYL